ncbi:unnamed protein product, partial [Dicrocoelium dendriticum]
MVLAALSESSTQSIPQEDVLFGQLGINLSTTVTSSSDATGPGHSLSMHVPQPDLVMAE